MVQLWLFIVLNVLESTISPDIDRLRTFQDSSMEGGPRGQFVVGWRYITRMSPLSEGRYV